MSGAVWLGEPCPSAALGRAAGGLRAQGAPPGSGLGPVAAGLGAELGWPGQLAQSPQALRAETCWKRPPPTCRGAFRAGRGEASVAGAK